MLYFILNYAIAPHLDGPIWLNLLPAQNPKKVFCSRQAFLPPHSTILADSDQNLVRYVHLRFTCIFHVNCAPPQS